MAHSSAIAAVGEAILALLKVSRPPEFSTVNSFELYNAASFKEPMTEGIALYLHRIVPANNIRNLPPRVVADRRFRPSLPIDLHYLLIAFAAGAARQQRLLGWAGRTLEDMPLLSASLVNQGAPPPAFGDTETIDVIMETLSIQDMGTVWEVAKPNIQPCLAYVVRMLTLDSEVEMIEAEAAQTRVFGMGAATP